MFQSGAEEPASGSDGVSRSALFTSPGLLEEALIITNVGPLRSCLSDVAILEVISCGGYDLEDYKLGTWYP